MTYILACHSAVGGGGESRIHQGVRLSKFEALVLRAGNTAVRADAMSEVILWVDGNGHRRPDAESLLRGDEDDEGRMSDLRERHVWRVLLLLGAPEPVFLGVTHMW